MVFALVDGKIRELDEKFSNGLRFPGDPYGPPEEVINCRCTADTRAKWALDEDELQTLKDRAEYFGLDKTENFEDFKQKYLKAIDNNDNRSTMNPFTVGRSVGAASKKYPVKLPGSKQHTKLAEGQTVSGVAFTGKGTAKEIRDRFRLEATYYKVPADEWQKVSGKGAVIVEGKPVLAELHWYEAKGQIVEMKVKRFFE